MLFDAQDSRAVWLKGKTLNKDLLKSEAHADVSYFVVLEVVLS